MRVKRREFLQTTLATAAATGLSVDAEEDLAFRIIDSNVSLFQWPFRRLPFDETGALVGKVKSLGITRAFAGSFEGVFHRDLGGVNRRLAEECEGFPELIPIGSVNPTLPGWEREVRNCAEEWGMPGIRLHPGYHGYALEESCFRRLLVLAAEAGLFVQLAAALEDGRTQNSIATVPDVNLGPLPESVAAVPGVRVQILNWRPRQAELEAMSETSGILFDTARVDGTDGVARLAEAVSAERVIFGSHAPFLIPEAALIRMMHESGLAEEPLRKMVETNAETLGEETLR